MTDPICGNDPTCARLTTLPNDGSLRPEETTGGTLVTSGTELGCHAGSMVAEEADAAVAGGVLETGGDVMETSGAAVMVGSLFETLGFGIETFEIFKGIFEAPAEGDLNACLTAGFGIAGPSFDPAESRADAAGWRAVLSGIDRSPSQLAAVRRRFASPPDVARAFDRAVAGARAARTEDRAVFAEAAQAYRRAARDYTDGVAAAVEGWSDRDRGKAFEAGRRRTESFLKEHPTEAAHLRILARGSKAQGFVAAHRSHIDRERMRTDPFYRSGVEAQRRLAAYDQTAERARYRQLLESTSTHRGSTRHPVRG